MKRTLLTRKDKDVGLGEFDSIAWAYEVCLKTPDPKIYDYAILYGNEDCPDRIEFFGENKFGTPPMFVWKNRY